MMIQAKQKLFQVACPAGVLQLHFRRNHYLELSIQLKLIANRYNDAVSSGRRPRDSWLFFGFAKRCRRRNSPLNGRELFMSPNRG